MKKTAYYSIVIVLLILANLTLFFWDGRAMTDETDRRFFDEQKLEAVTEISFSSEDKSIVMELKEGEWILNNSYPVDQGFFNTLLSVLERIEVNRSLEEWNNDVDGSVEVFANGVSYQFDYATNATQTKTYFLADGKVLEVSVPGYRDNVAGIFQLHPDQWRDRLVFDGSWRTIQQLTLNYPSGNDLKISFDNTFFKVNEQSPQDSTAVVDYLNQFEFFQANEMLSKGRFPKLDSLAQSRAEAILTIDDIKNEEPLTLSIFPKLPNQSYHLVINQQGDQMVIDARRISAILKTPKDFGVR